MAARKRATSRTAVLAARPGAPALRRFAPSPRSLLVGFALLALGIGSYAVARETSVFAVRRLVVVGGTPQAQAEVRAALAGELGRSLLAVTGDDVDRRVAASPDVVSVKFDRSFPHTLRVVVHAERAVLLLRRGNDGFVVSARGRVLAQVKNVSLSSLPRTWVPATTQIAIGDLLPPLAGGRAAAALAALRPPLAGRVRFAKVGEHELTFVLRQGLELRLGDIQDLRLKLAIARRILALLGPTATRGYVDVSVPERPVAGAA
ncbi:MAG: FtsQ-type POTRA domain-containing protein [Actinobacteria bacterium]|nr:FtsQ-type POTRA domain-containing protein [Actinomycetota bacterium]